MASLLHWDFAPGLKVADQVRWRFGSTVHFSASPGSKEFFLVASFSSASFPLSVESVGVALQCCIGGTAAEFRVCQLAKRFFRFSVNSNRVGHFIYSLRDRIWPDFICHFSLYKSTVNYSLYDLNWHLDDEISEIAARSPMAVKSSLGFLQESARKDRSSENEIAKFDALLRSKPVLHFDKSDHVCSTSMVHNSTNQNTCLSTCACQDAATDLLKFGSFSDPMSVEEIGDSVLYFEGSNFQSNYWQNIPEESLYSILDAWQAGYSDPEIRAMLSLKSIPSKDFIYGKLRRCESCF